ncbi:hypothetical protein [Nitrosomonas sp.]|uniref:hypothetical protein n=1 Tax=Nitrosomonas sp. TaxID=42353 RepID=UPI002845E3E9|nr:hypothetical protein [Nitrosomonas sp.]MDR4513666.1 hypothetical protein [Nitrosomonas sp.]
MNRINQTILKFSEWTRIYAGCLFFVLAALIWNPVQAGMENPDTGETCQGIDCDGFNDTAGSNAGSTSGSSSMTIDLKVIDCNATQEKDINAVAWNIADDWENFDKLVEAETGANLGNCTKNRFSKNGKVKCMPADKCKNNGDCLNGWSSPFTKKIKIYPQFLTKIAGLDQADRRACYASLLAHEFAHSCDLGEDGAEAREDAAFKYWKDRFAATTDTLNMQLNCGLD